MIAFLDEQIAPVRTDAFREKGKRKKAERPKARYDGRERDEIAAGIEMVLALIEPIQSAVLSKEPLSAVHVAEFLRVLKPYIRNEIHGRSETSTDLLARTVGLACVRLLFTHVADIGAEQAEAMVSMISSDRFGVHQKLQGLEHLARRPAFHDLAGQFAQHVSEQIRKDESIGTRGESYADLAAALVPMSIDEAREYTPRE